MNFNELMMTSITADQTAAPIRTETKQTGTDKSKGISFAQMLGSRMSIPSSHAESIKNSKAAGIAGQTSTNGPAEQKEMVYKSYRQVRESIQQTGANERQNVRKASSDDRTEWNDDSKNKKPRETGSTSSANVMQVLAQLLGVDQEALNKLLAESGISPEALNSLENTDEAAMILSDSLGLDPEQENTLRTLLDMIKDTMEGSQSADIPEGTPFDPSVQLTQEASEIAGTEGSKPDMQMDGLDPAVKQLLSQISDKLNEFTERLVSEQDIVEDEIEKLMAPLLKKAEAAKKNVINEGRTALSTEDLTESIKGTEAKDEQEMQLQEEDAGEEKELQMKDGDGEQGFIPKPVQNGDENVQQIFMNTASESARTADVSHIAKERQTVPVREIIGQIVEKAGAVITQDKAEMVMELKPESLGRISLKIVTENGIVMARFVAENRQVQQVLETNMQMLKDSLERQGINVQSLSVSVRQDERQQQENRQHNGNPQRIGNRNPITGSRAVEGITAGYVEANTGRNPYMWESSTINLTA